MATLIDWSEVHAEVSAALSQHGYANQSQGLAHVVLRALFGLTAAEIDDAITDGPNDRGIDAVVIQDTESPATVHLFQFKYVDRFERSDSNFPSGEADKVLSFIADLLRRDSALKESCNPLLWGKVAEIWDLFEAGPPRFEIHFVGNQAPMVSTHQERLTSALAQYRHFSTRHTDLAALASLLIEIRRPAVDADLRLVDNQYFERSDGNIRGLIATVQATDLIELIRDTGNPDRVNPEVFDENVRVYLTRKNRINQRIFETAVSDLNAHFWYLNNGVTMTCESFEYPPGMRGPVVKLKAVQIVNGGQTSNALFEAFKEAPEELRRVLLLVRIYELKARDVAARVAESTNSQTPIRSRDLRANDDVQRKLEVSLLAKGYFYERKADQHKGQASDRRLDAFSTGQTYVAYWRGWPEVATKDRGKIFGELYDAIFNDDVTADQLLASAKVFEQILKEKKALERAIRSDEPFDPSRLLLIDGAYFVLFAVGRICELRGIDRNDATRAASQYAEALTIVTRVVAEEQTADPAFAHKRFFKSVRAKQRIEEACRAHVAPPPAP